MVRPEDFLTQNTRFCYDTRYKVKTQTFKIISFQVKIIHADVTDSNQ